MNSIDGHGDANDLTTIIKGALEKKLSESVTYLEEQAKLIMKALAKFADDHVLL
jgi:hypothetical protein